LWQPLPAFAGFRSPRVSAFGISARDFWLLISGFFSACFPSSSNSYANVNKYFLKVNGKIIRKDFEVLQGLRRTNRLKPI
jgi:hypothetical protein